MNYSCNSQTGIVKNSLIDMPLSTEAFEKFVVTQIPSLNLQSTNSVKCQLTIDQMNLISDSNWSIWTKKNSTTQQRVLGQILLHYRQKKYDGMENFNLGKCINLKSFPNYKNKCNLQIIPKKIILTDIYYNLLHKLTA